MNDCDCVMLFSPSDYPCALHRDILLQGRLYLSEHWLCFYSNVFWGTKVSSGRENRKCSRSKCIDRRVDQAAAADCSLAERVAVFSQITLTLKDVVTITREKTARLIPNAIQVCTSTEKVRRIPGRKLPHSTPPLRPF